MSKKSLGQKYLSKNYSTNLSKKKLPKYLTIFLCRFEDVSCRFDELIKYFSILSIQFLQKNLLTILTDSLKPYNKLRKR